MGNNKNGTWKERFGEKNELIEAVKETYDLNFRRYYIQFSWILSEKNDKMYWKQWR